MKFSVIASLLGLLATAAAAPLSTHMHTKRSLPRLGGVNIAGCDFGMDVWGNSGVSYCPDTSQISHFVDAGSNVIRLPVGWQYLVNDQSSTSFNTGFLAQYDALVQATLNQGAYAIIDLHNYGRWNSAIVGQGGPSNEYFANVWSILAAKYANNDKVIFGLMNEPHDLDISLFAASCQAAVNAIRAAGATTQSILIPGNFWDHTSEWSSGANAPMLTITDPAASDKSLLVLDVHQYLDSDGSGTSTQCVTNAVDQFQSLVTYLKAQGRTALVTEIGAGNTDSCRTNLAQTLEYFVDNSDVIKGFTIWSAGNFKPYPEYELSITPNTDGSDNELFANSIKPYLPGNSIVTPPASSTSAPVTSTTAPVTSSTSTPVTSSTSSTAPTPSSPGTCTVSKWGQCGGNGYTGCTTCEAGSTCTLNNEWYSQCL